MSASGPPSESESNAETNPEDNQWTILDKQQRAAEVSSKVIATPDPLALANVPPRKDDPTYASVYAESKKLLNKYALLGHAEALDLAAVGERTLDDMAPVKQEPMEVDEGGIGCCLV